MLYSQDSTNVLRNRLITPKQPEQYARVGLQLIPLAWRASVTTPVTWSLCRSNVQSNGRSKERSNSQMLNKLCPSRRISPSQQGFMEDASKMIKRANDLSKDGIEVHGNVGYAKNQLNSKLKEEGDKEREILIDAEKERRFRVNYAEAFLTDKTVQPDHFEGIWETQWGDLEIFFNQDENTIRAEKQTQLSAIKNRSVSIEGTIKNLSGVYSIKVVDTTEWSSGPRRIRFI